MRNSTISDCKLIDLKDLMSNNNELDLLCLNNSMLPFDIKRIYYLFNCSPKKTRGSHAHKNLYQIIIAINGDFEITINDGFNTKIFKLDEPKVGLYIYPGIWRDITNFSENVLCLVLASDLYSDQDYIHDFNSFKQYKSRKL